MKPVSGKAVIHHEEFEAERLPKSVEQNAKNMEDMMETFKDAPEEEDKMDAEMTRHIKAPINERRAVVPELSGATFTFGKTAPTEKTAPGGGYVHYYNKYLTSMGNGEMTSNLPKKTFEETKHNNNEHEGSSVKFAPHTQASSSSTTTNQQLNQLETRGMGTPDLEIIEISGTKDKTGQVTTTFPSFSPCRNEGGQQQQLENTKTGQVTTAPASSSSFSCRYQKEQHLKRRRTGSDEYQEKDRMDDMRELICEMNRSLKAEIQELRKEIYLLRTARNQITQENNNQLHERNQRQAERHDQPTTQLQRKNYYQQPRQNQPSTALQQPIWGPKGRHQQVLQQLQDANDKDRNPQAQKPNPSSRPKSETTTTQNPVDLGNGWTAVGRRPAAGKRNTLIGNKKDTLTISKATQDEVMEGETPEAPQNQFLANRLTLKPKQQPKDIKATVIQIRRVRPRVEVNQVQWRNTLKTKGITPLAIFFPFRTTVEFLIPTEQEELMKNFMKEIGVRPADTDFFSRADGKKEVLPAHSKQIILRTRINMMKYEPTTAGLKYLEKGIREKLAQEELPQGAEILEELETVIRNRHLI